MFPLIYVKKKKQSNNDGSKVTQMPKASLI